MATPEATTIPINYKLPQQAMWVNLDREKYYLKIKWNTRSLKWFLSIFKSPDEIIIGGVPLYSGWLPFRQYNNEDLPPGDFVVIDSTDKKLSPGRYDLGTGRRVQLVYYGATL